MAAVRASDADRERVVDALRRATTLGYLNLQEFEDRLDGVYRATYLADLDGLLADIPGAARPSIGPASVRSAAPAAPPRRNLPDWARSWGALSPVQLAFRVGLCVLAVTAIAGVLAEVWFPLVLVGFFVWRRSHRRHAWYGRYGRCGRWPTEFA
jgi:hypothetical protein